MKLLVWLLVLYPSLVVASTITVNTASDSVVSADASCSLREALNNVNAAAETSGGDCVAGSGTGDTIVFGLTTPAVIKLQQGELTISRDVALVGPVPGLPKLLRIDGQNRSRVFLVSTGTVSFSNLTIERGYAKDTTDLLSNRGGGIRIGPAASVELNGCLVRKCKSVEVKPDVVQANAGGIFNEGTLTISDSLLQGNRAGNGPVSLGGAINSSGVLTVVRTTFDRNRTGGRGGGALWISYSGVAAIRDSLFIGNKAYHAVGGIVVSTCGFEPFDITNSTFYRNSGAILSSLATLGTMTNCTLSETGLVIVSGSTMKATNTIFGAGTYCAHPEGEEGIVSGGHNISVDPSCAHGSTDLIFVDPKLMRLRNNGGSTKTFAVCSGPEAPVGTCGRASPAVDAGDDAVLGPPYSFTTDQRGLARLAGAHVDIGAYESQ